MKSDSVLLGVHNRGGNKLDQFLHVDAEVTTPCRARRHGGRSPRENAEPDAGGLPQKIVGPNPGALGTAEGRYQGLLVLQVPAQARAVRIEEDDRPVAIGPDGNSQVIAGYVELDRGVSLERTVTFVVPRSAKNLRIEPSARVPTVEWSYSGRHWRDEEARTVRLP